MGTSLRQIFRLVISCGLIGYSGMALSADARIVSAGGSVTEILYALGAHEQVVATDTSSIYPSQAHTLPKVGYYRQLSVEGVLSMNPSALFVAKGAGPANVLEQLRSTGLKVHIFNQPVSVAGLLAQIGDIGQLTGKTAQAKQLQQSIQQDINILKQQQNPRSRKAVFLMSANERGLIAAGQHTVPNLIMQILGRDNPYHTLQGYKPISTESLLAVNPKHIFVAAHGVGNLSQSALCQTPSLKTWAETNGCAVHIVNPLLFLGLTPRLPQAISRFAALTEV